MSEYSIPIQTRERIVGGALVVIAVLLNHLIMGPATNPLSAGLIVAYLIWAFGRWTHIPSLTLPLYLLGIAVQCLHFGEEYVTGFQREFPRLFGGDWSDQRFVVFNLVWLALFILGAVGMLRRSALAYLVVIFFVIIGEIANGIAHLALSIARRQYFPGLLTATIALFIGLTVVGKLLGKAEERLPGGSETNE